MKYKAGDKLVFEKTLIDENEIRTLNSPRVAIEAYEASMHLSNPPKE